MRIVVRQACVSPDRAPFDAAERKGIGHPDSLADLVADTFSQRYAAWCLRQFGVVPNHWVDKVNLVGAVAEVAFGGFAIHKPIDCYLFGKITDNVGSTAIPIDALFYESVIDVLPAALGDSSVVDHLRLHTNNTRGVAVDHDREFYLPEAPGSLAQVLARESVGNDTVICVAGSRRGLAADMAVRLEQRITGTEFRSRFPAVGTDVKVMVVRVGADLDVTVAVPIRPEAVASFDAYRTCLAEVQSAVSGDLKTLLDGEPRARAVTAVALHLNTKDAPGRGYLAPFGTSLGKGDCGAVGRGNRYSGAIEPLRPASCEAPAGKNPVHHVGKIYTAVAGEAARHVMAETSMYAEVTIAARNGSALGDPAYVLVALDHLPGTAVTAEVERIVRHHLAGAADFAERFLATDTVERFRGGGDQ
jgi:S-adenosylmethionine synthetase